MAMLHIIRNSGFSSSAISQCLSMCLPQDSILLMDDGCYNLNHPLLLEALAKQSELKLYYIGLHASARAQSSNNTSFISSNLTDVLELLFSHDNSITWS
jgi:tRNA 2-thiouridine synthesizing protein B